MLRVTHQYAYPEGGDEHRLKYDKRKPKKLKATNVEKEIESFKSTEINIKSL